ncbi:MAG: hypothetical protein SGI74_01870 [Oligoflexia bacterium]|nr:hypothetical protein [Oligoflexia bacterium]
MKTLVSILINWFRWRSLVNGVVFTLTISVSITSSASCIDRMLGIFNPFDYDPVHEITTKKANSGDIGYFDKDGNLLLVSTAKQEVYRIDDPINLRPYETVSYWLAPRTSDEGGYYLLQNKWNPKNKHKEPINSKNSRHRLSMLSSDYNIWKFALRKPERLKSYGIYADTLKLFIPDALRMNKLLDKVTDPNQQVGPRFIDMPRSHDKESEQEYNSDFFFINIVKRMIPLASKTELLKHDRYEEHLLGGLYISPKLFDRLVGYAKFVDSLMQDSLMMKHHSEIITVVKDTFSGYWDELTMRIGSAIGEHMKPEFSQLHKFGLVQILHSLATSDPSVTNKINTSTRGWGFIFLEQTLLAEIESSTHLSVSEKTQLVTRVKKHAAENIPKPLTDIEFNEMLDRLKDAAS